MLLKTASPSARRCPQVMAHLQARSYVSTVHDRVYIQPVRVSSEASELLSHEEAPKGSHMHLCPDRYFRVFHAIGMVSCQPKRSTAAAAAHLRS